MSQLRYIGTDRQRAFDTGSDVTSRWGDHGFLFVFYRNLPSILYRFDVISAFVIAENGRKTISAARGRVRPEVKSPFDCSTPIWCRSVLEFFDYLLPAQSYSTFSICM
jgi:hypothetical protein